MSDSARQVTKNSRIELAAKAIDLTSVLLEATVSPNSFMRNAWEIAEWLGREKVNQHELLDCMEQAGGLAVTNSNGQRFFDEIHRGAEVKPVKPLFLQQSGSLVRLMASDPNLNWIVSTASCLFQHDRDDRVVASKLTAFMMESQHSLSPDGATSIGDAVKYNSAQTRLLAVVRKIASSVWFNVVNVGCETMPLPKELLSICPHGHYLDAVDYGVVISTINAKCPSKAILQSDYLLNDVLVWLLHHYDGTIVVNAGGRIVYRADFGNTERELELRVTSICSEAEGCSSEGTKSYKILRNISGSFQELLSAYSFSATADGPRQPGVRRELYEIPQLYPRESVMWFKQTQFAIKLTAQSMVNWLLKLALYPQRRVSSPGFKATFSNSSLPTQLVVFKVLQRIPAMTNLNWGNCPDCVVVRPDIDGSESERLDDRSIYDRFDDLCNHFAVLADLGKKISAICVCPSCTLTPGTGRLTFKSGCLRTSAFKEVLLLVADGIADGFGVDSASSSSDSQTLIWGMTVLLLDLLHHEKVVWDTWFMVASCVYLGCPFESPPSSVDVGYGGTAIAAVQYGNLATQAAWLDLSQNLTVDGCFGLVPSTGRLGVVTKDRQRVHFRGVSENFAVIETENTEDSGQFCSRFKKSAVPVDHHMLLEEDQTDIDSDVILCQTNEKFYRLFLRMKTANHWRIVDPSAALNGVICAPPLMDCTHKDRHFDPSPANLKIYTMDEVVGRWPEITLPQQTTDRGRASEERAFSLTQVLDTHLQRNVALALADRPIMVSTKPNAACTRCIVGHAETLNIVTEREGERAVSSAIYIINMGTGLAKHESPVRRLPQRPGDLTETGRTSRAVTSSGNRSTHVDMK